MRALDLPSKLAAAVISRARPFATIFLSDFGGRRTRQRLIVRGEPVPAWLSGLVPRVPPGETVVVAARGRAKGGATTRIRSIIVYPARQGVPELAYVYVEEWDTGARPSDSGAPFHVVRCAELPPDVRFVEIAHEARLPVSGRHLRSL